MLHISVLSSAVFKHFTWMLEMYGWKGLGSNTTAHTPMLDEQKVRLHIYQMLFSCTKLKTLFWIDNYVIVSVLSHIPITDKVVLYVGFHLLILFHNTGKVSLLLTVTHRTIKETQPYYPLSHLWPVLHSIHSHSTKKTFQH